MIGYLLDSSAVKKIPKIKPTMSEQTASPKVVRAA